MPSINYTTSGAVSVNLGLRNWTDQAAQHANLLSWCDLYPAARTEVSGRIVACAPRAGGAGLAGWAWAGGAAWAPGGGLPRKLSVSVPTWSVPTSVHWPARVPLGMIL